VIIKIKGRVATQTYILLRPNVVLALLAADPRDLALLALIILASIGLLLHLARVRVFRKRPLVDNVLVWKGANTVVDNDGSVIVLDHAVVILTELSVASWLVVLEAAYALASHLPSLVDLLLEVICRVVLDSYSISKASVVVWGDVSVGDGA
jgi:membrane-anchored protein YejM (alkaline phosphatase superfamily)